MSLNLSNLGVGTNPKPLLRTEICVPVNCKELRFTIRSHGSDLAVGPCLCCKFESPMVCSRPASVPCPWPVLLDDLGLSLKKAWGHWRNLDMEAWVQANYNIGVGDTVNDLGGKWQSCNPVDNSTVATAGPVSHLDCPSCDSSRSNHPGGPYIRCQS